MTKKLNLDDPLATFEIRYAIAKSEGLSPPAGERILNWILSVEGELITHVSFPQIAITFKTENEARGFLRRHGIYIGYKVFRVPVQTSGPVNLAKGYDDG